MRKLGIFTAVALAVSCSLAGVEANAKDLTIGFVMSMSGPYADYGKQMKRGVDLFMAQHGDTVAGRKVRIVIKDATSIAPQIAKRHAQELILKDKADVLAGFGLTPNAFSVAPLATEAKVPMVVMNAATSSVTERSPYVVRVSHTSPQGAWAMAKWLYDNNVRKAYTLASDYGPGHDSEEQFQKTFKELGGTIVGGVRTPVDTPDYTPFLHRMVAAGPQAAFLYVPPGSSMVSLAKNFRELGLDKKGILETGPGGISDEQLLPALGDTALGMITAFHYSAMHDSPENRKFVGDYRARYNGEYPNQMSMAAYDGMHLIYMALEKTKGDSGAEAFINAVKGMKWESPRGPVQIDPETRDIIQNEYIRKVEKVDGMLQNVEIHTYKAVKDPGK
ncbi:ABC transporter substrate-binding protein [Castellaniella sp. UC4442_H9]